MNRRKIILAIASLFMLSALAFAKSDTYIYDYWGEIEKSPDVYRVSHVLYADDLNLYQVLLLYHFFDLQYNKNNLHR